MAYRRSKGKARRKTTPAVMQIVLQLPAETTSYVDLALCASLLNRRGYKQMNTNWAVGQFEVFNPNALSTGAVTIEKIPETWVADNAYTKSLALWNEMNDQVLDTEPGIHGRYHDFKVGMDSTHVTLTYQDSGNPNGRILTPVDNAGNFTVADLNGLVGPVADWDLSKVELPNDPTTGITTGYTLHYVGSDTPGSKGMIAGYALSRSRPNPREPNVPTVEGWMNQLFDDGEQLDDIRDNLAEDNDRPPYPVADGFNEFYPGGQNEFSTLQMHSFCNFTTTTVSQKNNIMGGTFRNGLIKFTNQVSNVVTVILHMIPGSHKGYLVEEC